MRELLESGILLQVPNREQSNDGQDSKTTHPTSTAATRTKGEQTEMTTQQRIAQLEAMLREVEWRGASILHVGRWVCPVCRADTTDTRPPTHNPGCALARVLQGSSQGSA